MCAQLFMAIHPLVVWLDSCVLDSYKRVCYCRVNYRGPNGDWKKLELQLYAAYSPPCTYTENRPVTFYCSCGFLYNCTSAMCLLTDANIRATGLIFASQIFATLLCWLNFNTCMFVFSCHSWTEPWIWTRGVSSVQPSGTWGGVRSRTWKPLWQARGFDPRASNSRRTRRISTGKTTQTHSEHQTRWTGDAEKK